MNNKDYLILSLLGIFTVGVGSLGMPANGELLRVNPDGGTQTDITGEGQCATSCTITGSSRLGDSLFHSFGEFSIAQDVTVTFEDGGAANIFARVVGGPSTINGTLAVTGNSDANFFLLNPHGITFGSQAALVSAGSFFASTADHIVFSDDVMFSATDATPPLLTMSAPVGFQFGQQPGAIVNRSQASLAGAVNSLGNAVGLQVSAGKTLALMGRSIRLEGGNLTAGSGQVEIGSVAPNSYVSLSPEFILGYEGTSAFDNIQLMQDAVLDVSGHEGRLVIRGHNISLAEGAAITNFTIGASSAGSIELIADDSIDITGFGILFSAFPGSVGNGADLDIVTERLTIGEGAFISGGTFGQGKGGNVTINASNSVEVEGTGHFPSLITTSTVGAGTGGALTINTQRLSVTDGAQIQTLTYGPGKGGDLIVNATDRVDVSGAGETALVEQLASGILASSGVEDLPSQPTGEGGSLTINTGVLNLDEGGQVAVNSLGSGNSGNLDVNARAVRLDNNAQLTAAAAFGNGGNIRLENLELLVLRRGSGISTSAGTGDGQGDGGNISIEADFIVTNPLEDSDIIAKATQGRGGNIEINVMGIYGIEARQAIANNGTNDIDASSDFGVSGTIAINQLIEETDQGIVALSEQALETASLVGQGCQANGNRLVVTRRGGIPTVPTSAAEMTASLVDLGRDYTADIETISVNSSGVENTADRRETPVTALKETSWIEASGWRLDENAQVVLTVLPQRENLASLQATSHCAG